MPIRIEDPSQDRISLLDLVDYLDGSGFDPRDQESMASISPMLRKLGNNETFLSEMICNELKDAKNLQINNDYTPQVLMLHAPQASGQSYFIRACFWPGRNDEVLGASGDRTFFYGVPHDHNFNFLTIGYQGPGYESDYFEYDYASVCGIPGEKVDLKFMERSQLQKGSMMLYRAFQDVHQQMAPERFSVSLNIMEHSLRSVTMDQYEFEPTTGTISQIINRSSAAAVFMIAASEKNGESQQLLRDIFRGHAIDRVRMAALEALIANSPSRDAAKRLTSMVQTRHSAFMRSRARQLAADLEQGAGDASR
ncbi:HEAT repeat domain-containing protein [Stenotrophomonas sp. YAU14D1_LEIMI4_1]|uniref:HEAT repeat domain-containing protein n=1 Tax=Stenotrophomonas sp. YAU14D1_LEIMI4_1 TaxID=2072407 RepID=UPI000D54276D|nr:HEAT repeat domain-containing protein [Stenotrophomonas sp. YAU14D1_LEIMI4_1]AWH23880.1 transposase [Stenotrophomonas sp. YAU14D1_LEIMI4_1]